MATVAKKPAAKRKPKDNSVSTQFLHSETEYNRKFWRLITFEDFNKKRKHRNIFNKNKF